MKKAFIYTDAYLNYDYGPTHPLRVVRLQLTYELIRAYGLLDLPSVELIETTKAEEEDVALYHSRDYLNILKQANEGRIGREAYAYGLGPGDNPIFPGLYDWSLWATGATLQAVDFVLDGKGEVAFNIAGGLHHAMKSRAAGFCYINDPVIGILKLLKHGKRVAYIDLDAHHGDGVQKAFYDTDQVLTVSLHESGYTLFPGTGFEHEIGEGKGEGYSVNVSLPALADDATYLWAFEEIVPPLLYSFCPDVVVTQLGVDSLHNDPLTNLHLSLSGFERLVQRIKSLAPPQWVALGGGGYDVSNVARAWTLAWGVINGIDLDEQLPASYVEKASQQGLHEKELRGSPKAISPRENDVNEEVRRVVDHIKEKVFPRILR